MAALAGSPAAAASVVVLLLLTHRSGVAQERATPLHSATLAAVAAATLGPSTSGASPLGGPEPGAGKGAGSAHGPGTGVPTLPDLPSAEQASGISPVLLSAVVPGVGQYARGERRWVGYAAAEALAWFFHLERRGEGRDLRDRYRELAWQEARQRMGPRVVGDFEYYERLSAWRRSGGWDIDEDAGLQPETDPATFNGMIWQRARGLFFGEDPGSVEPGDPEWERALDFYREEAYGPELLWDWGAADADRRRFGELIEESDDHLSTATTLLGVVLLNHVASATDAFISGRLERATGGRVEAGVAVAPHAGAPSGRLRAALPGLRLDVRIRT